MSQYLFDQIEVTKNIPVRARASVTEVKGETSLETISITNASAGEQQTVPAKPLFIFIGMVPYTDWLDGAGERDEWGILTGLDLLCEGKRPKGWTLNRSPFMLKTNVPALFAVGVVRYKPVKRVAPEVGEGVISVQFFHQDLGKV